MTRILLLLVATVLMAHGAGVGDPTTRLTNASTFAFGGVGYAGTTSQEEEDFKVVYASKDAVRTFDGIWFKGTPQAKLYTLVAMQKLDKARFTKFSTELSAANPIVSTMVGSIVMKREARDVIEEIQNGAYARYLKENAKAK